MASSRSSAVAGASLSLARFAAGSLPLPFLAAASPPAALPRLAEALPCCCCCCCAALALGLLASFLNLGEGEREEAAVAGDRERRGRSQGKRRPSCRPGRALFVGRLGEELGRRLGCVFESLPVVVNRAAAFEPLCSVYGLLRAHALSLCLSLARRRLARRG